MGKLFPLITIAAFGGLTLACPSPEELQKSLSEYLPVQKVFSVEPMKELEGFCVAKIEVDEKGAKGIYTIFTDEGGNFAFPFLGELKVEKPDESGFKKVVVKSLRNKEKEYTVGWIIEKDGKRFITPAILKLKKEKP
jgi:hypothetical protein